MSWTRTKPECIGTGVLDHRGVEIVRIEQDIVLPVGFDITPVRERAEDDTPDQALAYAPTDQLVELLGPPPRQEQAGQDDDLVSDQPAHPEDPPYWDDIDAPGDYPGEIEDFPPGDDPWETFE